MRPTRKYYSSPLVLNKKKTIYANVDQNDGLSATWMKSKDTDAEKLCFKVVFQKILLSLLTRYTFCVLKIGFNITIAGICCACRMRKFDPFWKKTWVHSGVIVFVFKIIANKSSIRFFKFTYYSFSGTLNSNLYPWKPGFRRQN